MSYSNSLFLIYRPWNWQWSAHTSVPHPGEPRHCYWSRACHLPRRNWCYRKRGDVYSKLSWILSFVFWTTLTSQSVVQDACVAVAALLQYFLMAAFCWMLVEGIYLYLFVVRVYNIVDKMRVYQAISWGKDNRKNTVLYCKKKKKKKNSSSCDKRQ